MKFDEFIRCKLKFKLSQMILSAKMIARMNISPKVNFTRKIVSFFNDSENISENIKIS